MGKQKVVSEDRIQQDIVNLFSSICRYHNFMYFAVPNEAAMKGRRGREIYSLVAWLKKMGLIPGAADIVLGHRGKMYCLEVKSDSGSLSPNQKNFMAWAERCGVAYRVVRSAADAGAALKTWGIIPK